MDLHSYARLILCVYMYVCVYVCIICVCVCVSECKQNTKGFISKFKLERFLIINLPLCISSLFLILNFFLGLATRTFISCEATL